MGQGSWRAGRQRRLDRGVDVDLRRVEQRHRLETVTGGDVVPHALLALEPPSKPFLDKNSFYLSSAGFRVQVANDAAGKKAMHALPPHRFVVHRDGGTVLGPWFVSADEVPDPAVSVIVAAELVVSPQLTVAVWVSLVPGSVIEAVRSMGVAWGSGPVGALVMVTLGAALVTLSWVRAEAVALPSDAVAVMV